jgi:actin-related protein 9
MFPGESVDKWEPFKVRPKESSLATENGDAEKEPEFYEDQDTEAGAVWPLKEGRIVNWSCFFGLIEYIYNRLGPGFHTPFFLVGQPCWTVKDHQRITQYVFEKFRPPAFSIVDSALCSMWAHKDLTNACVVDIGYEKADVTAITDFCVHIASRQIAVPNCGGESFTKRLVELLAAKKFTWDMCEQLKKNAICEILPPDVPLPGTADKGVETVTNPASAASTGATGSGPGHRNTAGAMGEAPLGPGPGTENDGMKGDEDNEGVLDIANLVASGQYKDFLAKRDAEKAAKAKAGKGGDAAASAAKPSRLRNAEREHATFMYSDNALLDALKDKNLSVQELADAHAAVDEGKKQTASEKQAAMEASGTASQATATNGLNASAIAGLKQGAAPSREIEVGIERFQAATGGAVDRIADAIQRAISGVEDVAKRGELWDNLVVVGNGAKIRGSKPYVQLCSQLTANISQDSAKPLWQLYTHAT